MFSSLPLLGAFPQSTPISFTVQTLILTFIFNARWATSQTRAQIPCLLLRSIFILSSPQPAVYSQENLLCRHTVIFCKQKTTSSACLKQPIL